MKKIITITGIAAVLALSGCAVPVDDVETGSQAKSKATTAPRDTSSTTTASGLTDEEMWDVVWEGAMTVVDDSSLDGMCMLANADLDAATRSFMVGFEGGEAYFPTWTEADIYYAASQSIDNLC